MRPWQRVLIRWTTGLLPAMAVVLLSTAGVSAGQEVAAIDAGQEFAAMSAGHELAAIDGGHEFAAVDPGQDSRAAATERTLSAGFTWPDGALAAVSLTFDDARASQVEHGISLLERFNAIKVTFYVLPGAVEEHLAGWQWLAAAGHEIGNHSALHPCSGNFPWAREKALEEYSMERMEGELSEANRRIEEMLGVRPVSFAYPCGQTFVGRGAETRSYVPLVARMFESGRGWLDEGPNDPTFVDLAQLTGMEMDGKDFAYVLELIEQAKAAGAWLVLAGHEIGSGGQQTTRIDMLEQLFEYASDPENGVWMAPVGTVGRYVAGQREEATPE